jgi:PAS domain S-box-containing protein
MTTKLERELSQAKPGDHLCSIYENRGEQLPASVQFIIDGLARGERCSYLVDESTLEDVTQALEAAGVEVAHERERGALQLLTRRVLRLPQDVSVPEAFCEFLLQAEAEALADGFSGRRQIAEMNWALGLEPDADRLIEFEAIIDRWVANSKTTGLCHYNLQHFNAACIRDIIRTHSLILLGDEFCHKSDDEPRETVLNKDDTVLSKDDAVLDNTVLDESETTPESKARRVNWLIEKLKQARSAEEARDRALEELKRSERRLAEAQQVAHIGSWERDLRTNQVTWSNELFNIFGLKPDGTDFTYERFLNCIVPEDAARIRAQVDEAVRERRDFSCDYRIALADGSIRVMQDRAGTILNEEGEPIRLVGTAQDVTELRQAEQALQEYAARLQRLSRRLLDVQEEERRHLARELHDEVGQTLTALALLLQSNGDGDQRIGQAGLATAREMIQALLEKVRGLSFDLRPAELDELGLLPALLSLFERFTDQMGVRINFNHEAVEGRFASAVETTAYRITQESLTNVARHAGVNEATVRLWATSDTLGLQIHDRGRGFDPEVTLRAPRSAGLVGMRERVELLNGQLTIESGPGAGSLITAELPLDGSTTV